MNGMILRSVAVFLAVGLGFWGPAVPSVFAQLEVETVEACRVDLTHELANPDLSTAKREVIETALEEVVPDLQEVAEAEARGAPEEVSSEAKQTEQNVVAIAEVIHDVTTDAKQAVEDPDAVAKGTMEALAKNGVPAEVASKVEAQMRDALTKAKETLKAGGTLEDVAKNFEVCKAAMSEAGAYLGDKNIREILAAGGPPGLERGEFRSMEFVGAIMDPSQRDVFEACLTDHFRDTIRSGMETSGAPPQEALERMMACGISPGDVFRGGGEFGAPPKEVLDAMSTTEKAMFEAWKSGDTATMEAAYRESAMKAGMEAGMSPEHREAMEKYGMDPAMREAMEAHFREMEHYVDPRSESSDFSETTFGQHYTPPDQQQVVERLVATRDTNMDGLIDQYGYDADGNGTEDHFHSTPH